MRRTFHARRVAAAVAALAGLVLVPAGGAFAGTTAQLTAAESAPGATSAAATTATDPDDLPVAASDSLTTWWHDNSVATTGSVPDDQVRRSTVYDATVATTDAPDAAYRSFVYMSVPRSGEGKRGYTEQDGAEFSSSANLTMSWSSFEYSTDVWVDVSLKTGQTISSADQVTIRPTNLGFEKQLVDDHTIRVHVPYSSDGYRFSVEFDPQLVTAYNDMSGASGELTTVADGNRAVDTEPQNSMLVFANPEPSAQDEDSLAPTDADGSIYRPAPGKVDDLDSITQDIVYFGPGTYSMGADYRAQLPANVKWVYLAPGAYVKGAFRFPHDTQAHYKVTGLGVLSGEQYVYEADTANGYAHTTSDNCHVSCVKMLQFESSDTQQTLDLQGVTIASPPYHSFVVYAHDGDTEIPVTGFQMNVENYKQVGSWYWQTDGIELYDGGRMKDTFFHANDDVLKLYHSDVDIKNTVIWKNENGPVVQWGWTPRDIDGVTVADTDVIHNRMYWKDVKYNTCIFNSSSHWEDMSATDRADTATTVKNMRFTNTRVEGMTNCAIRDFALSNTRNVEIDGLHIDAWNDLDPSSQVSLLKRYTDTAGNKVSIGNETQDGDGILLHDYTVGGVPVLKAGDNWASDELGRLDFDADTWDSWDATSDGQPTGAQPALTVDGLHDGDTAASRSLTVTGKTDAVSVSVTADGVTTSAAVSSSGTYSATVDLGAISNRVRVTAVGADGVVNVQRFTLYAFGTKVGSVSDPTGDDDGPGSYTYPTDGAFNQGSFDLTGFDVYRDGDVVRFVASTAGEIHNPWGGNGMSTQRLNVYVRDGGSKKTTDLLPGTNTSAAGTWRYAVVADGRYDSSRFGTGVYGADLSRVGDADLTVIPAGKIVSSVPARVLRGVDLRTAAYQVSMFSDAEDGEGVGNVRPVYATGGQYRLGGGAGSWTDVGDAKDTDVTDSNALDVISGARPQSVVMDWTKGRVVVPYVRLDSAPTVVDVQLTATSAKVGRSQVLTIKARNDGDTAVTLTTPGLFGARRLGTVAAGATRSFTVDTHLPWLPPATLRITASAPDKTSKSYRVHYAGSGPLDLSGLLRH
ncbi:glucodextranase DOMON-like domain-containing protein [Luteimicrobium xylanilyticum]|nr:glucodextranase DOMON-like domain-containing protein [Luteimicrobium xylanilyticum]